MAMSNERETRKETGFWGEEKEVIYENGQKVAEVKSEERGGFLGMGTESVKVEYNTDGEEVSHTKQEERGGFFGIGAEEVQVRYNTQGEEIGQLRIEEKSNFLGIPHHERVEYDANGNEVSQSSWEKRGGFLGIGAERVKVTRYKDDNTSSIVVDSCESNSNGGYSGSNTRNSFNFLTNIFSGIFAGIVALAIPLVISYTSLFIVDWILTNKPSDSLFEVLFFVLVGLFCWVLAIPAMIIDTIISHFF